MNLLMREMKGSTKNSSTVKQEKGNQNHLKQLSSKKVVLPLHLQLSPCLPYHDHVQITEGIWEMKVMIKFQNRIRAMENGV